MDINQTRFTANNMSWNNLEMSMEDQILHDQLPLSPLWQSYPPQAQQTPSQSGHTPVLSAFVGDQMGNGNQHHLDDEEEEPEEELGAMKEMMFKIAAMQPVDIDPSTIRKPKRRNVRISDDPQSVAARHRRERISEKIRILQRLVPGGTKMDTASMLEEAIRYVKFLKRQIRLLQTTNRQNQQQQQQQGPSPPPPCIGVGSSDWPQVTYNSKPLVGTNSTSSSLDHQPQCSSHGLIAFGGNGRETICFNHEVISD